MQKQGVGAGPEDIEVPQPFHERFRPECDLPDRLQRARGTRGGPANGPVDDVLPPAQAGVPDSEEAGLSGSIELTTRTRQGHRGFKDVRHGGTVQSDRVGQCTYLCAAADLSGVQSRRRFEAAHPVISHAADSQVKITLHPVRALAPDEAAAHGTVEDFVGRTQVFADFVRLADYVAEEPNVRVGSAVEVVDRDVPGLAVAVEVAVALFQPGGFQGQSQCRR